MQNDIHFTSVQNAIEVLEEEAGILHQIARHAEEQADWQGSVEARTEAVVLLRIALGLRRLDITLAHAA